MYRQILISQRARQYQHILWRDSPSKSLCEYELCTVTYGVSVSPYQAIRVLHQLEVDNGQQYIPPQKIYCLLKPMSMMLSLAPSLFQN
ncbi:unnamed protein product [Macrosiphum euphorbiae]|uniref:Uncharacterized protein n=1 Tax=Macrosiphum euphorbiae TaxID=13131 RepID=A0AAV0WJ57_9HEMI|nr:unnamed protein product [Macrosiphum euphorbiae]